MDKNNEMRRMVKALCTLDGTYGHMSKASGIKVNLFWLLYVLDDGAFHTQKQICDDWLFSKTTINTLTKECETAGYITLQAIPGKKRELQICLTNAGRAYAKQVMQSVYAIEKKALAAALKKCSPSFIRDFEVFTGELQVAFKKHRRPVKG